MKSESESCSVVSDSATPWTVLEWVAFLFSRGSSQPRDRTQVSHTGSRFFTSWATREAQEYGVGSLSFSRASSWPRNGTEVSCIAGRFFTNWAMREAHNSGSQSLKCHLWHQINRKYRSPYFSIVRLMWGTYGNMPVHHGQQHRESVSEPFQLQDSSNLSSYDTAFWIFILVQYSTLWFRNWLRRGGL